MNTILRQIRRERHKQEMPRTALRYAIEKMPAEIRQNAMAKDHVENKSRKRSTP